MRQLRAILVLLLGVLLPRVAAAQPLAYVTNHATNAVHVFRTDDWTAVTTISVGMAPSGIVISSDGAFAYVANRGNDTVSRIDLGTNTVTATIPVPGGPSSVAITPDNLTAYVVQSNSCPTLPPVVTPTPGPTPTAVPTPTPVGNPTPTPCTVAAIDTTTNTVIATITVGPFPFAVAMSPSGGVAYVTNSGDGSHPGSISVIDARTGSPTYNTVINNVSEVALGLKPEGIAVGAGKIFLTNDAVNDVTVIREVDLALVGTVRAGGGPFGVAVSPDGTTAVVSNDKTGYASLIDMNSNHIIELKPVGSNPTGVAILPNSQYAVVANSSGNSISVVPLWPGGTPITVPMFGSPTAVAITPESSFRVSIVGFPNPAQETGQLTYTLTYSNVGTGFSNVSTLVQNVPDELSFVSALGGGILQPTFPPTITWTVPALPPGGSGSVQSVFTVNSPLPFGTTITTSATIDDAAGHTATDSESVASIPPGVSNLSLRVVRLNVFNLSRPSDNLRLKARFTPVSLSPFQPPFDPAKALSVIFTTANLQILRFDVPENSFISNRKRTSFRYRTISQQGGRVSVSVRPKGVFGEYEIVVTANRSTFTHPDSTTLGVAVIPDTQTFEAFERFSTKQFGTTRLQYSFLR